MTQDEIRQIVRDELKTRLISSQYFIGHRILIV